MMKKMVLIAALCFLVLGVLVFSATTSTGLENSDKKTGPEKVEWYTFDKGVDQAKKENKLLVVDFYTDWCHWCKVMDKETFANK